MISTHWLEKRKPHWDRLEALLDECNRHGIGALTRSELRELSLLYRQTAADLSALREDPSSQNFARALNQLLARAHNIIYAGRKSSAGEILRFYLYSYPQIFRRTFAYTAAAFGLFVMGAVVGLVLTLTRPEFMHQVLGPGMVSTIERREMWTHSILSIKPVASSAIMTNNLGVAFTTFATGITGGVLTVYMLVFNGLLLGIIGGACWMSGMSLKLWSFVAPHGVLELPAIFIAGGAGLQIAHGLLFPGTLSRRDSLAVAGGEAVRLVLGTIPMLIVAGVLEGFFSPTNAPVGLKFAVAAMMFAVLLMYVSMPAKSEADKEARVLGRRAGEVV
ncbi:MAG: stage II sporulation protein M [Terriglobales bacterium]